MRIEKLTSVNQFTGEEEIKEYYFHLNAGEQARIMIKGGDKELDEYAKSLLEKKDNDGLMDLVEDIVRLSVGVRTEDGRFVKSKEFADEFLASDAYGELFMKFLFEEGYINTFFEGVIGNKRKASDAVKTTKKRTTTKKK